MERFWCDQSPSWTVTAHMEQGCVDPHSHLLWITSATVFPGAFQVFLQAWVLEALQGTNTSDFPADAQ